MSRTTFEDEFASVIALYDKAEDLASQAEAFRNEARTQIECLQGLVRNGTVSTGSVAGDHIFCAFGVWYRGANEVYNNLCSALYRRRGEPILIIEEKDDPRGGVRNVNMNSAMPPRQSWLMSGKRVTTTTTVLLGVIHGSTATLENDGRHLFARLDTGGRHLRAPDRCSEIVLVKTDLKFQVLIYVATRLREVFMTETPISWKFTYHYSSIPDRVQILFGEVKISKWFSAHGESKFSEVVAMLKHSGE